MIKTKWRKKAKSSSFFFFFFFFNMVTHPWLNPWCPLGSESTDDDSSAQYFVDVSWAQGRWNTALLTKHKAATEIEMAGSLRALHQRGCADVTVFYAAARFDSPLNRCHRFLCVWDTCTRIHSEVFGDLLKLPKTVLQQAKHLRSLWNQSVILSVWTFEPSSWEPACPQTTDNTGLQKTERRQREPQQRHKELRYLPHCEKKQKKKTSQFGAVANLCLVHLMKTAHCALSAFVIACLWFFNQTRVIKTNLAGTGANLFPNHNLFPSSSSSCPAVNQYTEQ